MAIQQFPQMLYKGGDLASPDTVIARDALERTSYELQGYSAPKAAPVPEAPPPPPPSYAEFPRMLYHPSGETRIVANEAQRDQALVEGWYLAPGGWDQPIGTVSAPPAPGAVPSDAPEPAPKKRGRPKKDA